ncbi:MAG: acetoacetate--CoA ligase [Gemmatimonadota bacterium]
MPEALWTPTPDQVARANLTRFASEVRARFGPDSVPGDGYEPLYRWSIARPADFWRLVWEFCEVIGEGAGKDPLADAGVGLDLMAPPDPERGPHWFPNARLNFAENLLRRDDDGVAIVFWNEEGRQRQLSFRELRSEVAAIAAALEAEGVGEGDRVAGFLPNLPETVIAMLATASLGAVWSSCSPDFGVKGVLDRFGQIEPRVLVAADGYRYAGKEIDCRQRAAQIAAAIPSIRRTFLVPYRRPPTDEHPAQNTRQWPDLLARHAGAPLRFNRLPFDHPLYVMYSSGTTGLPKCMVHGAGGTLLQHLKELVLHTDLRRDERLFYYTTCGWMMWNWMVSGLAAGATLVLYDGAPLAPEPDILWRMAEAERVNVFGTSAKYLALLEKEWGRVAARDLPSLRTILSTGSPLAAHSFDFVYREIKPDVQLASISGGTDIISCFALGNPIGPVWRGELQCLGLGMRVEVFDEAHRSVIGKAGELVCTAPFPSMPVAFWNDSDGEKYRQAYFAQIPGVWRHGDWAERTPTGGLVIYGRSDATLNPGGVRIGTAEIYRQVEQLPEVLESLVIGQEWEEDVRIVLFVRLRDGLVLDDALRERIRRRIREETSPHHVPKKIIQVAEIPRTISGKITELAVRDVVHGRAVSNRDALANPAALDLYRDLPELRV